MNITIFCEASPWLYKGEQIKAYPMSMPKALSSIFEENGDNVTLVLQGPEEDGSALTPEILEKTQVLFWWGHGYHDKVADQVVDSVVDRVWHGMGVVFLHSAHMSKPFRRLMGTPCTLKWREQNESERLWFTNPHHPIFAGLEAEYLELEHEEMYGEPFGIPEPDELLGIGWFKGGNVFRSIAAYSRYNGRVMYFQPGHESNPTYLVPAVRKLLVNISRYMARDIFPGKIDCPCVEALEPLS